MTVTASKYALRENDLYETEEWATTVAINALKDLGLWRNGSVIDRISWVGNGETGTEDHAWYFWGPRNAEPVKPELLYQGNPTKRNSKTV